MDFRINDNNLEQWCFDYLENQLSQEDKKFFEQALEFDEKVKKELSNWEKTTLKDLSEIPVSPDLTKRTLAGTKSISNFTKLSYFGAGVFVVLIGVILLNRNSVENEKPIKELKEILVSKEKTHENDTTKLIKEIEKPVKKELGKAIPQTEKLILVDSNKLPIKQKQDSIIKKELSTPPPIKSDSIKRVPEIIEAKDDTKKLPQQKEKKEKQTRTKKFIPINDKL